ncbi:MAG: FAD-dependent oxidoreductase [Burkholderiales bacterium]|nr:MAG: FAD-dependent oxidoreductase [Burkholderiales bacterium]
MKILVQGAGLAGCAVASALAQRGHSVTVIERQKELFTSGAGILLYSNALVALDRLGVLSHVLERGFPMQGRTEFLDQNSSHVGYVNYTPIVEGYPAYVGIARNVLLKTLHDSATSHGASFFFGTDLSHMFLDSETALCAVEEMTETYDLVVSAEGVNSRLRQTLLGVASKFSGFGLWHSLHDRPSHVVEKITASAPGVRLGVIPISDQKMYVWASREEPENPWIQRSLWHEQMRSRFSAFGGWIGDLVASIDEKTYIHYTAVNEVHMSTPWNYGQLVFIGDAAHATTPFMAQGGAQALTDAVCLADTIHGVDGKELSVALEAFATKRFPITNLVQNKSFAIGKSYNNPEVNIERTQIELDSFYSTVQQSLA